MNCNLISRVYFSVHHRRCVTRIRTLLYHRHYKVQVVQELRGWSGHLYGIDVFVVQVVRVAELDSDVRPLT